MASIFILLDLAAKTLIMTSISLTVFSFVLPELVKKIRNIENEPYVTYQKSKHKKVKQIKKEGNLIVGMDFSRKNIRNK